MEPKIIEGTINFKITLSDEGVKLDYTSTPEHDIGALVISEMILSDTANYYLHLKNTTTGKDKTSREKLKMFTNTANVLKKGRTAVQKLLNLLLNSMEDYKEHQKEVKEKWDEKHEQIKKYLNDNNVTVENGMLSPEQVDELLKDEFKDLASPKKEEMNLGDVEQTSRD